MLIRRQYVNLLNLELNFIFIGIHSFNFEIFDISLATVCNVNQHLDYIRCEIIGYYTNLKAIWLIKELFLFQTGSFKSYLKLFTEKFKVRIPFDALPIVLLETCRFSGIHNWSLKAIVTFEVDFSEIDVSIASIVNICAYWYVIEMVVCGSNFELLVVLLNGVNILVQVFILLFELDELNSDFIKLSRNLLILFISLIEVMFESDKLFGLILRCIILLTVNTLSLFR